MSRPSSRRREKARSPRFDVSALREAAGAKVYARGVEYHQDGQVEIVAIDSKCVVARVRGSELYRTELVGKGCDFSGNCSCRAFSDWGFCKHMVAAALAVNAGGSEAIAALEGRLSRIRDHLRAQGLDSLIDMIMRMGERDSTFFAELELAAAMDRADDKTLLAQFKKAIAEATRTSDYVEYGEMRAWAEAIGAVLGRIERLLERGRAGLVLQIIDAFFERMAMDAGAIDDSDGDVGALLERGAEIHLCACQIAKPESIALARELFAREMGDLSEAFSRASAAYADILGATGLAEYRRLAEAAWAKIKPRRAERTPLADEQAHERFRLQSILQDFAKRDGNVDALIALHTKDLSSAYRYLQLAELCREHERDADALRWAEEGLWLFERNADERLVVFVADLYRRGGRAGDAEKLLWQCFERQPSLDLYAKLKKAAPRGKAGDAAEKAITLLKARAAAEPRLPIAGAWSSTTTRDLLVQLLMGEKRLAEAWEIAANQECYASTLTELARAIEELLPHEATKAYAKLVDSAVARTGNDAYREACRLVARMGVLRGRHGEAAAHSSYVDDLLRRHKAKRNFVKLLRKEARLS